MGTFSGASRGPSLWLLGLSVFLLVNVNSGASSNWKWTHDMNLPSSIDVKWIVDSDTYLTMQVSAPTQGYIGVGFSPAGGMHGADIILGWVDDQGVPHLKDYYATSNAAPIEDPQQDVELLEAEQNAQGTRFVFRRKWDTCDTEHDIVIGEDTMKFIWAWSPTDPVDNKVLHYHGAELGRGVRGIFMKHQGIQKGFPDEDPNYPNHPHIKHWDLHMTNYIVPRVDTAYQCKIFKLPRFNGKRHMIAHRPLVTAESSKYVHHINLYRCSVPKGLGKTAASIFEPLLDYPVSDCYADSTPSAYKRYCVAFILAFAVGSEGDILPDHLGDPVESPEDGDIYLKMEVHYDNPKRLALNDSSGVRIFHTDELRQYEVAMLFLGHRRTPFLSIPPRQNRFKITGYCPKECTQNGFPPTGIKIYSILLHTHLWGRKIILRHIRNGKELKPIAQDNNYDFSYQQYRLLRDEVTILPGDELIAECDYNTEDKDEFVFGGLSTRREMCEVFPLYYPKTAMFECRSQPEFYSYLDAIQVRNVSGSVLKNLKLPYDYETIPSNLQAQIDDVYLLEYDNAADKTGDIFTEMQVTSPDDLARKYDTTYDEMKGLDWKDENFALEVENKWRNGPLYSYCSDHSERNINKERIKYLPKYEPYVPEKSAQCLTSSVGKTSEMSILLTVAASLFVASYSF